MAIRAPLSDAEPQVYIGAQVALPEPGGLSPRTSQAVSTLLAQRRQRLFDQRENAAMEAVAARAIAANRDGTPNLGEPGLAPAYQAQFRKTAETVYTASLNAEATEVARELAAKTPYDEAAFASAWGAYMGGQLEAAQAQSPVVAYNVELGLNEIGRAAQTGIAEASQAKAKREQTLGFSRRLQTAETSSARFLLHNPDEESYYNALEQQEAALRAGVSSGLLTATQGGTKIAGVRERLTEEYARGQFRQAMIAGDTGQAKAVVRQLRAGKWFDDLDDGRALADSLAAVLDKQMAGVKNQRNVSTASALDYLRRQAAVVRVGGSVDVADPVYQEKLGFVLANGSAQQRQNALQARLEVLVRTKLGDAIDAQTSQELTNFRAAVVDLGKRDVGGLDSDALGSLTAALDDRLAAMDTARATNNWMALAPEIPLDAPPAERAAARVQVQALAQRELAQRAARRGRDPEKVAAPPVPQFSTAQYAELADQIQTSRGDPEALASSLETLFAPARSAVERIGMARRLPGRTAKVVAVVTAVAGPELALRLSQSASKGAQVDEATRKAVGGLSQDEIQDLGLVTKADALAFGDVEIRSALVSAMQDAYWGFAADAFATNGGDAEDAHKTAKALLARSTTAFAPIELVNGAQVPTTMLADTSVGVEGVARAINTALATLPVFEPFRADGNMYARVVPTPLEDGSIGFVTRNAPQRLLVHDGKIVRVDSEAIAGRAEREFKYDKEQAEREFDVSILGRYSKAIRESLGGLSLAAMTTTAGFAGKVTGGDSRLNAALVIAADQTPDGAMASRAPNVAMHPEWAQIVESSPQFLSAYNETVRPAQRTTPGMFAIASLVGLEGGTPNAYTNPTGAMVGASLLLEKLRDKYGDVDQALAAYWMGPGALEEVLQQAQADGVSWEARVPSEAMQFVERVREEYGR